MDGISRAQGDAGIDIGAAEDVAEPALEEAVVATNGAGDVTMAAAEVVEPQTMEAAQVAAAEEEEEPTGPLFVAPEGDPDDLKKISGVGPVLEQKLHSLGITKLDQIANFSDEEIEKVDSALNFKGRIQRDDWIGQARALTGED